MNLRVLICSLAILPSVGCNGKRADTFTPLTNGFGYVTHVNGGAENSLTQGLWYQDSTGKRTWVWPFLQMVWGENAQFSSNIALVVGGVLEKHVDGEDYMDAHLIVFQAPNGPPMDITDEIYKTYCKETGIPFTNIIRNSFVGLTRTNDSVRVGFSALKKHDGPPRWSDSIDATVTISWLDIGSILADVKKNGTTRKEKRSGIEYLKAD
jgi:hypothetical protein